MSGELPDHQRTRAVLLQEGSHTHLWSLSARGSGFVRDNIQIGDHQESEENQKQTFRDAAYSCRCPTQAQRLCRT